jgi:HSP90 family molecular chaperone
MMMEKFLFTVDGALLSELGERLVESAHIALLELVKNAYDADATEVTVKIIPRQSGGPDIEIADNGVGMTFGQVQSYWMRIATTHKVGEDTSPTYGRPLTGSKGIGRFSCRRLGTRLTLATAARKGLKEPKSFSTGPSSRRDQNWLMSNARVAARFQRKARLGLP